MKIAKTVNRSTINSRIQQAETFLSCFDLDLVNWNNENMVEKIKCNNKVR